MVRILIHQGLQMKMKNVKIQLQRADSGDAGENNVTEKEDSVKEHIEFHDGRVRRKAVFGNEADQDELMPIERKLRKFNPLVIPKYLQKALPFASKPKDTPSRRRPLLESRRAVVMEPREQRVHKLLQNLQLIRHEKMKKRKQKEEEKRKVRDVEKAKEEQLSKKRLRDEKRERYREQDKHAKKIRRSSRDD